MTFVTICAILGAAAAIIAYGRGYRIDLTQNSLKPTGLISATSNPIGAQVYIDGVLKTATNNSFGIDPGFYTVKIAKESYIPWEKKLRVQGEVVSRADAFLFPTNPSLSPLTTIGIQNPTLSPDGTRVAYIVPTGDKAGLWYYELSEGPLGRNRDPVEIAAQSGFVFAGSHLTWAPDASEILVENTTGARLYTVGKTKTFTDVADSRTKLFADWRDQRLETEKQKLSAFPQQVIDIATSSAIIISFSPDETKLLYEATAAATIPQVIVPALIGTNPTQEDRAIKPGKLYVYDMKEDKNYFLLDKKELDLPLLTPTPTKKPVRTASASSVPTTSQPLTTTYPIHWFPTSRHLILTLKGKIDAMEFDRTNWVTIYSGPFVDGFVAPWNDGSRFIILTNLNGDALSLPNLYTVNLR